MSVLTKHLLSKGLSDFEGHCQQLPSQVRHLAALIINCKVKDVLEIGFNAGHSAEVFLSLGTNVNSYDIGDHGYVLEGKRFIDQVFPKKHTLVIGDSKITIPMDDNKYDCFFIDGGHDVETAYADLKNCFACASPGALVIMDDVVRGDCASWNLGPNKAWADAIENKLVVSVYQVNFPELPGRGMAIGLYDNGKVEDMQKTIDIILRLIQ